jgi:hypothetical protein
MVVPTRLVLVADDVALDAPAALALGDPAVVLVLPGVLVPVAALPLRP